MKELNAEYWEKRWLDEQTNWDIGQPSPPLIRYLDKITDKTTRILIPGAGRAYEAIYLHQQGFQEVYVCDWAPTAFNDLRTACPDFPTEHLLVGDFFELDPVKPFDLLLEQTFFCAIEPGLRPLYVRTAANLLAKEGHLAGLLFAKKFSFEGPPFGGTIEEYRNLFSPYFLIKQMEVSPYSIAPRAGSELFVEMKKN